MQEKAAARSADARDQWTRLNTRKANKKLNMDISADAAGRTGAGCRKRQRRRGAEAVGRQALAERAASEAKFVLIAERKTQEEA